ncbi:MAG: citramalate synthase [Opitutales bacterium]
MTNKMFIYDTTLRDGTQGEGVSLSVSSKLRLVTKLDTFGVDYIEGGWPGSNPRDMAFFEEVKKMELKHAKIAAFGSTRRANIEAKDDNQLQMLLESQAQVLTIFGKTWLLHVTEVIKTEPQENLDMIKSSVAFLKENGREVIYDAEHFFDGYKDNAEYAMQTLAAAVAGGADFLCLCDTNGGTMVEEFQGIVKAVIDEFNVPVGVHCHNDTGLAVALSLCGAKIGAKMIQGTMNGVGERTGNANLCTIMPNLALKLGKDFYCAGNMSKLRDLSLFADEMINIRSDAKAPYVGLSAFAHKGGVHADAANKVSRSYEHIDPALVGNKTRILISDMSGRASLKMKASEFGVDINSKDPQVKDFLDELKKLEFKGYGYEAADASFSLLLSKFLKGRKDFFKILSYKVSVEKDDNGLEMYSLAKVNILVDGVIETTSAQAKGPVEALDTALKNALIPKFPQIRNMELTDFKVRILDSSAGTNATTRVNIETKEGDKIWETVGASVNVIEAACEALKDALEYRLQMS